MKLLSIQIKNYRSVENVELETPILKDKSFTYGLIGINEAGKSSILKAVALKDGLIRLTEKDFEDKRQPVEIVFNYEASAEDLKVYNEEVVGLGIKNETRTNATVLSAGITTLQHLLGVENKITVTYAFTTASTSKPNVTITVPSHQQLLSRYQQHILENVHKAIFWTAEDKFLISEPIDLNKFAVDSDISIPLKNCFLLAGIEDIQSCVSGLSDSTDKEHLEEQLGDRVTEHIKAAWPNHPIKITFDIDNLVINFHVRDSDAVGGKAKTANQRSDGFKQFISFLLTVSAQNKNELLRNAILLLDEPETHLHPRAQEHLLDELIKITSSQGNNIVFFATHSNYMIDKNDLSRNFKIEKKGGKTIKKRFDNSMSTYASVNYVVYDVPSTDYHNELYSALQENFNAAAPEDKERLSISSFDKYLSSGEAGKKVPMDRINTRTGKENSATLPSYIRNCIHHPENDYKFTREELIRSIELLRSIRVTAQNEPS